MAWKLISIWLLMVSVSIVLGVKKTRTKDVSFSDAQTESYSSTDLRYYRSLYYDSDIVYIGVTDYSTGQGVLIKTDPSDITKPLITLDIEQVENKGGLACESISMDAEYECKNHIKVIQKHPPAVHTATLFVCGTNVRYPVCYDVDVSSSDQLLISQNYTGEKRCPKTPDEHIVTTFGKDDKLYTATKSGASDYLISRFPDTDQPSELDTEGDTKWQEDPEYISMYSIDATDNSLNDDMTVVFFRETASENTDAFPDKLIYSRIAKVCEKDEGGTNNILTNKWTSYLKARLDCSVTGSSGDNYQQFYDVLEDTTLIGNTVYGVFRATKNGFVQPAMCSFSLHNMSDVFASKNYWYQSSAGFKWHRKTSTSTPYPGQCIDNSQTGNEAVYTELKSHPLMESLYPSVSGPQLTSFSGTQFSKIVGQQVDDKDGTPHTVLFIGTNDGTVIKALELSGTETEVVVIEEIQVSDKKEDMYEMIAAGDRLVIGFEDRVTSVPMYHCSRRNDCHSCVGARDPYCAWNGSTCVYHNGSSSGIQNVQNRAVGIVACPETSVQPKLDMVSGIGTVSCPVRDVKWKKDDEDLYIDGAKYIASDGFDLKITSFKDTDEANYTCVLKESDDTEVYSADFGQIEIQFQEIEGNQSRTMCEDKTIELYCHARGPYGMELNWLVDGDLLTDVDAPVVLSNGTTDYIEVLSTLKVNTASLSTAGNQIYSCKAYNEVKDVTISYEDCSDDDLTDEAIKWDVLYFDYSLKMANWYDTADDCTLNNEDFDYDKIGTCTSCQCKAP